MRAIALQCLSHEAENSGDPEAAIEYANRAWPWPTDAGALEPGDRTHPARRAYAQFGKAADSASHLREALPVLWRLGAEDDALQGESLLAMVAIRDGDLAEAEE